MKKKVYTGDDIAALLRAGKSPDSIPADAVLTPSAKDALRDAKGGVGATVASSETEPAAPIVPDYEYHWEPGGDARTQRDIISFFNSPAINELKEKMVDIGRRMWEREYTDGNGGNLTIRVGDNLVLCTPTMVSKGFLKPEHMCLVDLEGRQLAGKYKRTSECLTHLGIIKRQPKAKACCHAHPPHGTAFAVAGVKPPTCLIPEAEVFLGEFGMADYRTPGTPEVAKEVGEAGVDHMAVLMLNHGVITWGKDVEDAYWRMENVEAYCKTVAVAVQLDGGKMLKFTSGQVKDLIAIRESMGMDDKRKDWKECELCDNSEFRPGTVCQVEGGSSGGGSASPRLDPDAEKLVQKITEEILKNR